VNHFYTINVEIVHINSYFMVDFHIFKIQDLKMKNKNYTYVFWNVINDECFKCSDVDKSSNLTIKQNPNAQDIKLIKFPKDEETTLFWCIICCICFPGLNRVLLFYQCHLGAHSKLVLPFLKSSGWRTRERRQNGLTTPRSHSNGSRHGSPYSPLALSFLAF